MSAKGVKATKRPSQFVDVKSAEDIAIDIAQTIMNSNISLKELLTAIFTSTHSAVVNKIGYFYHDGAVSAIVNLWATKNFKNNKAFIDAATNVVITTSSKELDQLSESTQLRHPANNIDLDKLQQFKLSLINQNLQQSAPTVLGLITQLATSKIGPAD
ncbi:hypothetical protein FBU30_010706 [Linnemannia zychae]|nr:hypothetical protein FBU30_010706 [Linnemannia zychae]